MSLNKIIKFFAVAKMEAKPIANCDIDIESDIDTDITSSIKHK
jgi:hypothetical protein